MNLSSSTFEEHGPGYTARLQQIDPAKRQAYLQQVTGRSVDPFASKSDGSQRYLTFLIEIVNDSDGSLVFQPQNCWLMTDKREVIYPIGLEGLRTAYGLVGQEMAPAYERAGAAVLEGSRTLEPGQQLSGLLAYPAPRPRTRRYAVDFQFTTAAGEVVRLNAPYRRVKPGPEKRP